MSWLDIHKNERLYVNAYKQSKLVKITPPQGYTDNAYQDIDEGRISSNCGRVRSKGKILNFDLKDMKKKKLWELSTSPAKSIIMNIGMSYMSPNEIQVIPITMLCMLFINTFKELFQVNEKFEQLDKSMEGDVDSYDVNLMKLVYILSCCGNLAVGIWKLNSMGLIPTKTSDWLAFEKKLSSKESFV